MTRTVELTTHLPCDPEIAWRYVQTSALLDHVAAPMIRFKPLNDPFPEVWREGEYRATMLLFGLLPIGWQAIRISFPEPKGQVRFVRDDGYGPLIKRWDHWIAIAPDGRGGTRYTDQVTIDSKMLTPIVAAFAKVFYAHRQRQWGKLARNDFAVLR